MEEALNVLAKEHHELEQTVVTHLSEHGSVRSLNNKFPRFYDTDDDEFHDAFEAGYRIQEITTFIISLTVIVFLFFRFGFGYIGHCWICIQFSVGVHARH